MDLSVDDICTSSSATSILRPCLVPMSVTGTPIRTYDITTPPKFVLAVRSWGFTTPKPAILGLASLGLSHASERRITSILCFAAKEESYSFFPCVLIDRQFSWRILRGPGLSSISPASSRSVKVPR